MSDEKAEIPQSFSQKATACVPRYVSHSVGASVFLLAYGMAQSGVFTFTGVLVIEAYFTGCSLLYVQEMVKHHQKGHQGDGIQHNNYFVVIEKNLSEKLRPFVRILFIIDVINCTAFYYTVARSLMESLIFTQHVSSRDRTGTTIFTFALTTIFMVGMEYGQKYIRRKSSTVATHMSTTIVHSKVEKLHIDNGRNEDEQEERGINMAAVAAEMNNFDRKRPAQLLLFMLMFFSTIAVSHDLANSEDLRLLTNETVCPGLTEPIEWMNFDFRIITVVAIVLYALKNYSIMLPVCVEELHRYTTEEFKKLILWSEASLAIIYFFLPLSVYLTFGESTPVLFIAGYGKNIVGMPLAFIALMFTADAMLLRIIACFKLMQVLFSDNDTENVFWLVVIFSVFLSLMVSLLVGDVTYLVIFAGAVTCNLLINIIPSIAYLKFKQREGGTKSEIVMAIFNTSWHVLLLFGAPFACYWYEPSTASGCRNVMNTYWK